MALSTSPCSDIFFSAGCLHSSLTIFGDLGNVFAKLLNLSTFSALPVAMLRQVYLEAWKGPSWGQAGAYWAPKSGENARDILQKSLLGRLETYLEGHLSHLGPFALHLDLILGRLGPSWNHLGAMLGHLGAILGHLGAFWSHPGAILGHLGPTSGPSSIILGPT